MKSQKTYNPQNTLAILSLGGFDELKQVDDAFVSFRFDGETYETTRMEGKACIGITREVFSNDEYWAGQDAGEDLMKGNPNLQCFYSSKADRFRIRLWADCNSTMDYEKNILQGIDELEQIGTAFQVRLQHHLFQRVAPEFETILHKR